jgi:hypothetical protein
MPRPGAWTTGGPAAEVRIYISGAPSLWVVDIYISDYIFLTVGVVHPSPPEDGSLAPATLPGVPGDHGGCGRHSPALPKQQREILPKQTGADRIT